MASWLILAVLSATYFLPSSLGMPLKQYIRARRANGKATVALIGVGHPSSYNFNDQLIPDISLNPIRWHASLGAPGDRTISLAPQSNDSLARGVALNGRAQEGAVQNPYSKQAGKRPFFVVRSSIAEAMTSLGFRNFRKMAEGSVKDTKSFFGSFSGARLKNEVVGFLQAGTMSSEGGGISIKGVESQGHMLRSCETYYTEARAQFYGEREQLKQNSTLDQFLVFVAASKPTRNGIFSLSQENNVSEGRIVVLYAHTFRNLTIVNLDLSVNSSGGAIFTAIATTKRIQLRNQQKSSPFGLVAAVPDDDSRSSQPLAKLFRLSAERNVNFTTGLGNFSEPGTEARQHLILRATRSFADRMVEAVMASYKVFPEKINLLETNVASRTKQEIRNSNQRNDVWNLVLAITALYVSVVMMTGLTATRFWLPLRVILEVIDLCIGALPGAALLVGGLGFGRLHLTPLQTMVAFTPTVTRFRRGRFPKERNEAIFSAVFAQCDAIGMWRSVDRSAFLGVYISGIVLGILVILLDLIYHLRKIRRERLGSEGLVD